MGGWGGHILKAGGGYNHWPGWGMTYVNWCAGPVPGVLGAQNGARHVRSGHARVKTQCVYLAVFGECIVLEPHMTTH